MKILPTSVLRLCGLLLGLALAAAAFSPPAVAATTITLSADVTNTDGVPQTGTVTLPSTGSVKVRVR